MLSLILMTAFALGLSLVGTDMLLILVLLMLLFLRANRVGNEGGLDRGHVVLANLVRDRGQLKQDAILGVGHLHATLLPLKRSILLEF